MATSGFPGCIAAVHSSETGITVQLKSEHHNEYEQQRVSQWEATHKLQRQHNASYTPSGALLRSTAQKCNAKSHSASPEAETAREHHLLAVPHGGATCIHAMGRVSQTCRRNVQVDAWRRSMCSARTYGLCLLWPPSMGRTA